MLLTQEKLKVLSLWYSFDFRGGRELNERKSTKSGAYEYSRRVFGLPKENQPLSTAERPESKSANVLAKDKFPWSITTNRYEALQQRKTQWKKCTLLLSALFLSGKCWSCSRTRSRWMAKLGEWSPTSKTWFELLIRCDFPIFTSDVRFDYCCLLTIFDVCRENWVKNALRDESWNRIFFVGTYQFKLAQLLSSDKHKICEIGWMWIYRFLKSLHCRQ